MRTLALDIRTQNKLNLIQVLSKSLLHDKNLLEAKAIIMVMVIFRTLFRLEDDEESVEYIKQFEQCGGLDNLE